MKKPNWKEAPEGATHWNGYLGCPWLIDNPPACWEGKEWIEYPCENNGKIHLSESIPRPPKKQKKHERIAELLAGKTISGLTIGEARELGGYLADGTNLIVDTSDEMKKF